MSFILIVLAAILFFAILAGLVLIQLPLAYYLNDKWLKMKNRSAKVGIVICALLGFGCYTFTVGGMAGWSPKGNGASGNGQSENGFLPPSETSGGGGGSGEGSKSPGGNGSNPSSSRQSGDEQSGSTSEKAKWTELALKYISGIILKPDAVILRLNAKKKEDFDLTESGWNALRDKLALDPIVHPEIARTR